MALIPQCTVVTACYDLTKYHNKTRPMDEIIFNISPLLQTPCYLVIYCNSEMEQYINSTRQQFNLIDLTKIIVIDLEDTWAGINLLNKIKYNRSIYWPTKDERTCSESHALVSNKFDFVYQAIVSNYFNTDKFAWIDCFVGPNFSRLSDGITSNVFLKILHNVSNKFHIQILNVQDKKYKIDSNKKEYYQTYPWVVCGNFFTTPSHSGKIILARLKEIALHTTNQGFGHGEEPFYLEVLDEFYNDIDRSYGDYRQVLQNYFKPVHNINYIYHFIVLKYYNFKYYKECIDVCKSLINSYDSCDTIINYDLYVKIYIVYFLALVNSNQNDFATDIANKIIYLQNNPYFKEAFKNNNYLIGSL
jgi:hypothetical protein